MGWANPASWTRYGSRSVLAEDIAHLRTPRNSGARSALRVVVAAREQMTAERTRMINALTALVRTEDLGIDARTPLSQSQVTTISKWRISGRDDAVRTVIRGEARRLTARIKNLDADLAANRAALDKLIAELAPQLPTLPGVRSVVAASVVLAWSHPGRVLPEAPFGPWPVPARSRRPRATLSATDSTGAETGASTGR